MAAKVYPCVSGRSRSDDPHSSGTQCVRQWDQVMEGDEVAQSRVTRTCSLSRRGQGGVARPTDRPGRRTGRPDDKPRAGESETSESSYYSSTSCRAARMSEPADDRGEEGAVRPQISRISQMKRDEKYAIGLRLICVICEICGSASDSLVAAEWLLRLTLSQRRRGSGQTRPSPLARSAHASWRWHPTPSPLAQG